ncbi:cell division protein FtsK [Bacillus idriensis]|uniref:Cell division protein FtsK n=1 Tax=Metabacillus idriensis TaxID=324768 RepID=A0A6I2MCG7_9BACI|nr:cell division protein FtsK [Metabacillus idriensis]
MIIEIVSSVAMSGILAGTYFYQSGGGSDDHRKIEKIAAACGLVVNDGGNKRSIRIHRRAKGKNYAEYVYQIPLGLSFADFERKQDNFQDGLNVKRVVIDVSFADFKAINWRQHPKKIAEQIRKVINKRAKQHKEIEMEYDGMLKIRVYDNGISEFVPFDDDTLQRCKAWQIPLGETRKGFVTHDTELGHMVVAGATRYGKSVFLKNVITTLIARQSSNVKFTLIDLKGGLTFARYNGAKQVETIAKDVPETLEALRTILEEMTAKQAEYLANNFEDIKEAKDPRRHFIVVDEAAQLASKGITDSDERKMRIECETILAKITQIGGGLGYRLIFCTQYPTADTLPRQIKQNSDTKVCFRLQTAIASTVVLDEEGAESLPQIKGRAIYMTPDGKQIVQTPFIENEFIRKTIEPYVNIRARKEPNVNESSDKTRGANGGITLIVEDA